MHGTFYISQVFRCVTDILGADQWTFAESSQTSTECFAVKDQHQRTAPTSAQRSAPEGACEGVL